MDKGRLKREGLAFGRTFQRAYRLVGLYINPDHPAVDEPILRTYEALNDILKQTPQFTFGFFNHRVVLNDLLTPDPSLEGLDTDFFKRGIVAVSFSLGITFREFKRGLALLTTKEQIIERDGGIQAFVRKNQVEGMRILAADKKSEAGDTDIGMDFQAFMVAQTMLDPEHIARSANLQLLMQSAGEEAPPGFGGSAKEVLELVDRATQASFVKNDGNPKATVESLTRLLEELSPDYLLSALPEERAKPLRGKPAGEVAYVLAEDVALEWARKKFFSAGDQAGKAVAEEQIIQVLGRALRTTQVADRLLQKIAEMVEKGELPVTVTQRVRDEMDWASWTLEEKHSYLMKLQQFSLQDFRHMLEYMKDAGHEGHLDKASQIAEHYLACVERSPAESRAEGMAQVPELIRILTGMHSLDFVRKVVDQFREQLREPSVDWQLHQELAGCLSAAAQSVAMFEDFEAALNIGEDLEQSRASDPEKHLECCDQALRNLLSPATVERMIELSIQKRGDPKSARAMANLLRLVEGQASEIVFRLLEEEKSGPARSRLLHLARQLGDGAFKAAFKRLGDDRWYVVRNACYILGALNDPDLATHLNPALHHSDTRVQQAAITAILRSTVPGRGGILVRALPSLQPHLQETVLDELLLLRDPSSIDPLEGFLLQSATAKIGVLIKAMRGLIAIPDERIVGVLHSVLIHGESPLPLRRLALQTLKSCPYPSAREKLYQFRMLSPTDPLVLE